MRKTDKISLVAFASFVMIIVLWVRINLPYFRPVLEASPLFFQLILAATIIAVLRNVVGIKTFGVFGPTIIAFGLISAGLMWGLALYIDVFIVAMSTSLVLYPLGIASSHRVAVIITITVITITILELMGEIYHMDVLQTSILFPVLITSWLADRYVTQVKEQDWVDPSKRLVGTILVVVLAYLVISVEFLVSFIVTNPETWALLILANLFIALKINYRFSEHFRFKPITDAGGSRSDALSLNKRNRDYISRYNPRSLFPHMAKDRMKIVFHQLGIPAPKTFSIIQNKQEVQMAEKIMKRERDFVIKPAHGLGGEGILVVKKTRSGGIESYRSKGREMSLDDLKNHIYLILDGQYSSEWSDTAIIEERIETNPSIVKYIWGGVPDIRIIVFEGFPVMAMTRLPTRESEGSANLHKGAIGMGLTIAEGKGVNPFWRGHGGSINRHPDTDAVLTDLRIDNWPKLLEIASLAQVSSRMGYVGVDIVLDVKGPMVLEVNKRPGLEIQNTNLAGLLKRIEFIEKQLPEKRFIPIREKVELSRRWDREGWK